MNQLKHIKAVVFDWAGTMIDHGSRAPAIVFVEIFRRQGDRNLVCSGPGAYGHGQTGTYRGNNRNA